MATMIFEPIPGSYSLIDYDSEQPYDIDGTLEFGDEDDKLLICDNEEGVYILREQVDKVIEYLEAWKNSPKRSE